MTADEFRTFLADRGWTQTHAASVLGVRQSRISEWSTGARKVPPYIAKHCETLERCPETEQRSTSPNVTEP